MASRFLKWALITVMALPASPALAQCGGGAGGGGGHAHDANTPTRSEKKSEKTIRALLSEEPDRSRLMDAILADSELMRVLVERIAADPERRALAAERIGASAPPPERSRERATAGDDHALYTCPMHPEVRSERPGRCPKCGMTLRRAGS